MRRHLIWLSAILVGVSACDDAESSKTTPAGSVNNKSGSFVADYFSDRSKVEPANKLSPTGDWRGVLFCASGVYPINLAFSHNGAEIEGVVSIQPAVGDTKRRTPFHAEHLDRTGTAEYLAAGRLLEWVSPVAPGTDTRVDRGLSVNMMLAPSHGNAALIVAHEVAGPRTMRSCQGVARRDEAAKKIDDFIQTSAAIQADRRAVVQERCPAVFKTWIDGGLSGEDVFSDERFAAAFGAPFYDMSAEALLQASALISGSCLGDIDKSQRIAAIRQAATLRNVRSYNEANETYLRTEVFDNWRGWIEQEIDRGAPIDQSAAAKIRSAPHNFDWRDHHEFRSFDAKLAAVFDEGKSDNQNISFAERIEYAKDDFRTLANMRLEAESRGDIDMDMVAAGLNYYLENAATKFAEKSQEPRDAIYMQAWSEQQNSADACLPSNGSVCAKAAEIFRSSVNSLSEEYSKAERPAFDAIAKSARGLDGLASLVSFERDLKQRYAGLLTTAQFEKNNIARARKRRDLQRKNARKILAEVEASVIAPDINAVQERYFVDDDLDETAVKKIKLAVDKALADTRPFTEITNAEYFNALYNQDFKTLRVLDRKYMNGIRPLMSFGAQQAIKMGPLIDALSGQVQGTTAGELTRGLENLSALYAVLGAYLISYDGAYGKCLQPDARTIEISRRTDLVTTDGFGNEIRRQEGWTDRDYYRINPEFSDHFDTLFNAATGTAQAQLLDLFLNDANVTRLRRSVEQIMSQHDCASPEVKRLEEGFLAYDRELTKR